MVPAFPAHYSPSLAHRADLSSLGWGALCRRRPQKLPGKGRPSAKLQKVLLCFPKPRNSAPAVDSRSCKKRTAAAPPKHQGEGDRDGGWAGYSPSGELMEWKWLPSHEAGASDHGQEAGDTALPCGTCLDKSPWSPSPVSPHTQGTLPDHRRTNLLSGLLSRLGWPDLSEGLSTRRGSSTLGGPSLTVTHSVVQLTCMIGCFSAIWNMRGLCALTFSCAEVQNPTNRTQSGVYLEK